MASAHLMILAESPIAPKGDELVVGTIAFLIIFAVFWRKLLPSIQRTLAERTDLIEGGMKRAEEAQASAHELQEQYQRQLTEARHDAAKIREHAAAQAAQTIADARGEAGVQRDAVLATGRAQLDADAQAVRSALKGDLGKLAVELASKIVGESLEDEARQRRTVDRFLEELEAKAAAQESAKSPVGAA